MDSNPSLGMAWLRLAGRQDTYIGVCYMPPVGSTYYRKEDGALSIDAHWEYLERKVTEFSAKGRIIIGGDFNARTKELDDRPPAADEGDGDGVFGPAMPPPRRV